MEGWAAELLTSSQEAEWEEEDASSQSFLG
jgi:hypothetical protein